jgi:membrane-bound ClpP family serine protease
MKDEILDRESESKSKEKFNWTIWVGSVFIVLGLVKCQMRGILFENSVLFTLALFLVSVILNWFRPKLGVVVTTLIFLLGMFGACQLFPKQEYVGIGFGDSHLWFEIYSFLLLIGHFSLTSKSHRKLISSLKKRRE